MCAFSALIPRVADHVQIMQNRNSLDFEYIASKWKLVEYSGPSSGSPERRLLALEESHLVYKRA